jgi:outer membrane protein TolC
MTEYQQSQANKGPQPRTDTEGADDSNPLALLEPSPETAVSHLQSASDPNDSVPVYKLSITDVIARSLSNSPEIRIVSFDPEIAKQQIIKEVAEFDPALFGQINSQKQETPANTLSQSEETTSRLYEAGIKQKGTTGLEWSASYLFARNWDSAPLSAGFGSGQIIASRFEPVLAFQIRQPLLRNAWQGVNLAGVNIATLNQKIAMASFRQKSEDIATQIISAYWLLLEADRDIEIQRQLFDSTTETYDKVMARSQIDATNVQINQAQSALKEREAILIRAKKRRSDVQDELIRLLADPQLTLVDNIQIQTTTDPFIEKPTLDEKEFIGLGMTFNPILEQARIELEIAQINIDVAKNQKMPRLDLIASASSRALSRFQGEAHDSLMDRDYTSYAIGVAFEYPLGGNRQRRAEYRRRQLERSKVVSSLQNIADQVAVRIKERIRQIETDYNEMLIQEQAIKAAAAQLSAIEDTEKIREKLSPEFLLVKLQAQQSLAEAQRASIRSIADYSISLTQLNQATGTVLQLHQIQSALPDVLGESDDTSVQ